MTEPLRVVFVVGGFHAKAEDIDQDSLAFGSISLHFSSGSFFFEKRAKRLGLREYCTTGSKKGVFTSKLRQF